MFCNVTCKENATNSYHVREAKLQNILEKSGLAQEEWFIALRIVLNKPLSYFLDNRKELLASQDLEKFSDEDTFHSSDYSSLFKLVI